MIKTDLFKKAVDNTVKDSFKDSYNIVRTGTISFISQDNRYCSVRFNNNTDTLENIKIPSYINNAVVGSDCVVVSNDPNYNTKNRLIYVGENNSILGNAWINYTPTWTGLSIYNGTVTAKYCQIDTCVFYRLGVVFGTSTNLVSTTRFSLPVTSATYSGTATTQPIGRGKIYDVSAGTIFYSTAIWANTSAARIDVDGAGFGAANLLGAYELGASFPFKWANTDEIFLQGFYESI